MNEHAEREGDVSGTKERVSGESLKKTVESLKSAGNAQIVASRVCLVCGRTDGFHEVGCPRTGTLPEPISLPAVMVEALPAPVAHRNYINGDGYMECPKTKREFLFDRIEYNEGPGGNDFPTFCPLCGERWDAAHLRGEAPGLPSAEDLDAVAEEKKAADAAAGER